MTAFIGDSLTMAQGRGKVFVGQRHALNLAKHVGDQLQVEQSRLRLAQQLGCDIQWLRQVHGVTVFDMDCDVAPSDQDPTADAAVTSRPNTAIAILTADCLPLMFADINGLAVAGAHAGWRGLANGIIENTIESLLKRNVATSNIRVFLGPCIGPDAFEVGSEVRQAFVDLALPSEKKLTAQAFYRQSGQPAGSEKFKANLLMLARLRLQRFDVDLEHAALSESKAYCTYTNPDRYFSYRFHCHHPEQIDGRQATLIWLPDQVRP
jgi:polyphenol oxidase